MTRQHLAIGPAITTGTARPAHSAPPVPIMMTASDAGRKGGRRAKSGGAVDVHVGKMIRARRVDLGLSQSDIGEKLGVAFQQIQKYENGSNRISAGRLFDLAGVLGVSVAYFFPPQAASGNTDAAELLPNSATGVRLVKAFNRIRNDDVRQALAKFAEAHANAEQIGAETGAQ